MIPRERMRSFIDSLNLADEHARHGETMGILDKWGYPVVPFAHNDFPDAIIAVTPRGICFRHDIDQWLL